MRKILNLLTIFVRSQHHRERTWSYNEISRRYTDKGLQFYTPNKFRTQHKSNRQASTDSLVNPDLNNGISNVGEFQVSVPSYLASDAVENHNQKSLRLYEQLIESGVCREQARGVLPQNLYTQYFGTANLHNLLKFVSLRSHEGAQWEIQRVADACLEIAEKHFPESVRAYRSRNE